MELVYLWVEEYKNIKRQGFNFSPRFRCEFKATYDENNKIKSDSELKIIEIEEIYPKSFFNSSFNVTAIVGENGSGKSSLIELLMDCFSLSFHVAPKCDFIFVFKYNGSLKKISNIDLEDDSITFLVQEALLQSHGEFPSENTITDTVVLNINNEYEKLIKRNSPQFFNENSKKTFREVSLLIIENYIKYNNVVPYFYPREVHIDIKKSNDYFSTILDEDKNYYEVDVWKKIVNLMKDLKEKSFIEKLSIVKEIFYIKANSYKEDVPKFTFRGDVKDQRYFHYKYRFDDSLLESVPELIKKYVEKDNILIIPLNELNQESLDYLNSIPYIFDFVLRDHKKAFYELSFGERQMIILINNIIKYAFLKKYSIHEYNPDGDEKIHEFDINKCIVFIDEFELGLHPSWQKSFLNELINFFKSKENEVEFVISSHSPFLLSDLPKESIVFLSKGKQVYPFENGQTFGANIHTLLSHGFFMKDGLVGKFAKSKIEEVIKFLNDQSSNEITTNDEAQNIINIIGEPIIKRELQRKLDSKKLSKLDKIDDIEEQMKLLEERLEILRKNQK